MPDSGNSVLKGRALFELFILPQKPCVYDLEERVIVTFGSPEFIIGLYSSFVPCHEF